MAKHATVEAYLDALPGSLPEVGRSLRRLIDENLEGGSSAVKWAQPVWSLGKQPVCYLKGASRHLTFGFWRGASIKDPSGRLESAGSRMAHVKLFGPGDVDARLFADWLRQARELEIKAS